MKMEMLLSNLKPQLPQLSQLQLMSRLLHLKLKDTYLHLSLRRISLYLRKSNP
jgi:hypothetical protein